MKAFFKNSRTGEDIPFTTEFTLEKKDGFFEVEYKCKNSKFYSANTGYNTPIYEGDVCEIFISLADDIYTYYEIEVAPNNSVFFKKVVNKGDKRQAFAEENTLKTSVEINGNDYTVKMIIPYASVNYDVNKGAYFNAYRIETEGGYRDKNLLALNPTMSDTFHQPDKFIKL